MDRRIARTRNALCDALIVLVLEKDWAEIQISEICVAADVARSTFYAHFDTKQDLLNYGFERFTAEMVEGPLDRGLDVNGTFRFVPPLLAHIESHAALFNRMRHGLSRAEVFARFRKLIVEQCRAEIEHSDKYRNIDSDLIEFVASGLFGLVDRWVIEGPPCTPTAMTERIDRVVGDLLRSIS